MFFIYKEHAAPEEHKNMIYGLNVFALPEHFRMLLIRFTRAFSHVTDLDNRIKFLTANLLKQGYRYHKLRKAYSKFHRRHFELIEKYHVSLKKTYATMYL